MATSEAMSGEDHIDSLGHQDSSTSVSWLHMCKEQFRDELQAIEALVQNPPPGRILMTDLHWELRQTQLVRGLGLNRKKGGVVAQQCFIPTTRVADFIEGMQSNNASVLCKYVKIRTKPAKEGVLVRATPAASKDVSRYHCQYGPEDHTGQVKTVTSSMLPRIRRKVLLATAGNTRRGKMKCNGTDDGTIQAEPAKKKRGRPKKTTAADGTAGETNAPKKRKGKQKKASIVADSETVTAVTKKPRGRPRKTPPVGNSSPPVKATKPRGRPKKGSTPAESRLETLTSTNVSLLEVPTKKPRGRPKKVSTMAVGGLQMDRSVDPSARNVLGDPNFSGKGALPLDNRMLLANNPQLDRNTDELRAPNTTVINCFISCLDLSAVPAAVDQNFQPQVSGVEEALLRKTNGVCEESLKSTKPAQKKRNVPCKRAHRPKTMPKKLMPDLLCFDLNVAPVEAGLLGEGSSVETSTVFIDSDTAATGNNGFGRAIYGNGEFAANPVLSGMTSKQQSEADVPRGTDLSTGSGMQNDSGDQEMTASARMQNGEAHNVLGSGVSAEGNTVEPPRPKKLRDSQKQWGGSLKRGCLASFSVKMLLLLPHVSQICIYEAEHVNSDGKQCHGFPNSSDRSAFAWHLSPAIKEFVLAMLRNGLSVSQVMAKHIAVVKTAIRNKEELTRDMFLHERDVRNLATKVARETYMLHADDAKSVQLWVQQNRDSVFYYSETGAIVGGGLTPDTIPFTVGIQTPWQREMMNKFGHESAVSIDATFGTNEKKFPLYTVMVFDEWHNGIPVAFIVTSRTSQEDLTPWMRALDSTLKTENATWKPNAFIVDCAQGEINSLRVVWPFTAIFLCLWHVHRAWQKQACIKIADADLRAEVIRGLGAIMYDRGGPAGQDATAWAIQKLQRLQTAFPAANEFWDYITQYWLPKVHMWVVGYRNLPYAGQDTNAAVENYHGYMKSILKSERSRLTGRRVDWCVHALTGDVLTHYWYQHVRKQYGFVENRKERDIVLSALIRARNIPDNDVTLPEDGVGPALVTSQTHRHLRYVVHNPTELWASCNCVHSQKGNTCKHKVRVLLMLRPHLAEGTVARYCGALKGTAAARFDHVITPPRETTRHDTATPGTGTSFQPTTSQSQTPAQTNTVNRAPRLRVDQYSKLETLANELLHFVQGSQLLMDHLEVEFNRSLGTLKQFAADMESGLIHPGRTTPVFRTVQDGLGMGLVRLKDRLELFGKASASRSLRWGAESPA